VAATRGARDHELMLAERTADEAQDGLLAAVRGWMAGTVDDAALRAAGTAEADAERARRRLARGR